MKALGVSLSFGFGGWPLRSKDVELGIGVGGLAVVGRVGDAAVAGLALAEPQQPQVFELGAHGR